MDVIYLVRPGESNEELRYSLRSLANLPHDRVWFVGHRPSWIQGVTLIPGNRQGSKARNVYDNLRLACDHIPAERFVVMNDDFFIMRPVEGVPSWHRRSLDDHIASLRRRRDDWYRSLVNTRSFLREHGHDAPLSYELHVPVVMDRERLGEVLDLAAGPRVPCQWRTLYGNWWQVPSTQAPDCKIRSLRTDWDPSTSFLSSDDATFRPHAAGQLVRDTFPCPSPYEEN